MYEILPVLLPVCLTVFLCAALFFGQAALRSARREQRFRKKKDGEGIREMYAAVLKTAKFQGVEIKEPLAEDMAEQLYTEYPELEEKEWEWMYNRAMESMFYHLDHEKNDWVKMRTLYIHFRKAALGRMSRGQRWRVPVCILFIKNGKGGRSKTAFYYVPLPYSVNQKRKSLLLSCSMSLKFSSTTARAFSFGTLRTSLSISLSPIAFVSEMRNPSGIL